MAMMDSETGELTEKVLKHKWNAVRESYSLLKGPVVGGVETTGAIQCFLELQEELGIQCRVGHPYSIIKERALEPTSADALIPSCATKLWEQSSMYLDIADAARDVEKVTEVSG